MNNDSYNHGDRPDSYSMVQQSMNGSKHSDATKQIVTKYSTSTTNQGFQASKHLCQNVPIEKEMPKFQNKENIDENQMKQNAKREGSRPSSSNKRPVVGSQDVKGSQEIVYAQERKASKLLEE
jgi:hypothetical protein